MGIQVRCRALVALVCMTLASALGCVADRPSRNGVFNENQYLRKDFLIRAGDATTPDRGWLLKATVVEASEPNVYGDATTFGLFSGSHNQGDLMHFVVTSDKLQMVSNREINADPGIGREPTREPEVINAWPVTNVDLKYQINLDGEKTNFYQENQELDWQVRQWVKVTFDKNDFSDLAPLGSFYLENIGHCVDMGSASATLVPDSFIVDETNDYMEWTVQITLPILWSGGASSSSGGAGGDCVEAYGAMARPAAAIGRQNETVSLKYSMTRTTALPTSGYQPLVIGEKDPIQHKYGPILYNGVAVDPSSGLLGANAYVVRFDPQKPIDWYFESGFPPQFMPYFTSDASVLGGTTPLKGVTTIEDATNKLLADAGARARVKFHLHDEAAPGAAPVNRAFGDVRFNMLRWIESQDQQSTFAGVTNHVIDPRTGQTLSADIVFENFAIQDLYVSRIDAYLQTVGLAPGGSSPFDQAAWPASVSDASGHPVACASPGDVGNSVPIVSATVQANHNGSSTLFQKIQDYLYEPESAGFPPLGPRDFVAQHLTPSGLSDDDFYNAYFAYLPYVVTADPATNPFVTPESGAAALGPAASSQLWQSLAQESQLHQLESQLDQGFSPFDVGATNGEANAVSFMNDYKALSLNHRSLQYTRLAQLFVPGIGAPITHADTADSFSMVAAIQKDARHCVDGPEVAGAPTGVHWETKAEWVSALISSYWSQVFWHEFGHAMGLEHNFMGSVDRPNFPPSNGVSSDGTTRYPMYSSSVMEYNAPADHVFWALGSSPYGGWAPYDQGALSWIYANDAPQASCGGGAGGISGQVSASCPWKDPHGFDATGKERAFLYCNERHTRYTPLCRPGDLGTTPSEIVANDIEEYEWQYQYRNFRQYHKFWDDTNYGDVPMNVVTELRRFLPLWAFDMSSSQLASRLPQIGVAPPSSAVPAQTYYAQLVAQFQSEMDQGGALSAAFHEAIVQQTSGARPYATTYDSYFGDVTQQGIILDKIDAIQAFTALWPVDNYNPTVSAGYYISSYAAFGANANPDETSAGSLYQTVAEQAVLSMLGGSFQAFEYSKPMATAQFDFATHDPNYLYQGVAPARPEAMQWGGGYQFSRLDDFLAFFRQIAIQNKFVVTTEGGTVITCSPDYPASACTYDPRTPQGYPSDTFYSSQYNTFLGPDGRRWIWAWFQDRNQWVACDEDRNVATFTALYNYTQDVVYSLDDGSLSGATGGSAVGSSAAFQFEATVNYTLDFYAQALLNDSSQQLPTGP